MPRRLRVRFPVGPNPNSYTLPCVKGTFALTGIANQFSRTFNQVVNDTWTKISGNFVSGDVRAGPNLSQGWNKIGINTSNGELFTVQGSPTNNNAGVFLFSPITGEWRRTNAVTNDWRRGPVNTGRFTFFENYDVAYDPVRNCFWRSDGGPFPDPPSGLYNNYVWAGEVQYSVTTDEFRNYWPTFGNSYSPTGTDTGYFNVGGTSGTGSSMSGFDSAFVYWNDNVYQFNSFSEGTAQNLKRRNLTTGTITTLATYGTANFPPWSTEPARMGMHRGGFNDTYKQIWTLANNLAYYVWDESKRTSTGTPAWELQTTSNRPTVSAPSSSPGYSGGDFGMSAVVDEAANCMVVWCGRNETVTGQGGGSVRATYIMDLATRAWRNGPSLAGGQTVPPGEVQVVQSLLYDRANKRTVLAVQQNGITEVWALNIAPIGGKISSFPLPSSSGSTYGVNYSNFPYTSNGDSKHTNMCYCPSNNRLYVSGGDASPIGSNARGIWSMDLADGSWRLEVGLPVLGSTPGPNGMQDGALFAWMPTRNKMLFGWGGYFTQVPPSEYARGTWTFDPLAVAWTQDLSFFTAQQSSGGTTSANGSGNPFGGVYDETTDRVYVLLDAQNGTYRVARWDIATMTQLSNVNVTPPSGPAGHFPYWQGQQVILNRWLYAAGYFTNGAGSFVPAMWRWNIDTGVFQEVARPPNFTQAPGLIELRLGVSNGKIVHPRHYGPTGTMPEGIYVYNPANDSWLQDTKTPTYGSWRSNAVGSIPPCSRFPAGAVAMSGATPANSSHIWFYEAT